MSSAEFKEKDLQTAIGWILRAGIFISMIIVVAGGCFYLYRHGQTRSNYTEFTGIPQFISTPRGIINGIAELRGQAIIQAGIILLIATPVLRVIFSAIGFILEKDWLYVGITFIVLLVIVFSIFSGHAG